MYNARVTRLGAAGPSFGAGVDHGLNAAAFVFDQVERPHLDIALALAHDDPLPVP